MLLPILSSLAIFTPGWSMRRRYMLKSCVTFSDSKSRTTHSMYGEQFAPVLKVFVPFTYSLPSFFFTVVVAAAESEPACGSEKPSVKGLMPLRPRSQMIFCCSGEPKLRMSSTSSDWFTQQSDGQPSAMASSATRNFVSSSQGVPPNSSGMPSVAKPASTAASMAFCGSSPLASHSLK